MGRFSPAFPSARDLPELAEQLGPLREAPHITGCTPYSLVNMGVSENSVPLHPMVNDHYPY